MTLSVDSAGLGLPLIRVDVAYTVEKSTFWALTGLSKDL